MATVGSRTRRTAARVVGWVRRARPPRGPACRFDHVAVLDGRTLTGEAHLSGLAQAQHLALRLTTRDSVRIVDVAVVDATARDVVRFAALLEPGGTRLLEDGRWRVELQADGRSIPTTAAWDGDRGGPTEWNPRSPATAVRYRPAADQAGTFLLTARSYAAHAEVDRTTTGPAGIEVRGRIVGVDAPATGTAGVTLAEQSSEARIELPCTLDEDGFAFTVPAEILPATGGRSTWRATLHRDGSRGLKVRKALTDLRDPPSVFRFAAVDLPGGGRITPSFTGDGTLVLSFRPPPDGPPA